MSFAKLFGPARKKITFKVTLHIHELTNVPTITGFYSVKWKIKHSGPSNKGVTSVATIKNQTVIWNYHATSQVHTAIAKDAVLMPSWLCLRVKQELNGGKDAIPIGNLTINLAEYAKQSHHSSRYMLEDCKMNCALRISISMEQTSGEKTYSTPPMHKGVGLAGGISSLLLDRREGRVFDDTQSLHARKPGYASSAKSINSTRTALPTNSAYTGDIPTSFLRDTSEASAADIIENLFSGGDGGISNLTTRSSKISYGLHGSPRIKPHRSPALLATTNAAANGKVPALPPNTLGPRAYPQHPKRTSALQTVQSFE